MRIKMKDIQRVASTNYQCPQCGTVWTPEEARGLGGNCGQCGTKLKTEYEIDMER
jgi:transcription initiation factor IIE alpha subunit